MNSKKKRFSIIIASYNVEKYISECIESVLNQSFSDYELIIVDDCSTDETRKVIEKYKDERIRVCTTNENTGTAGGSRNIGMKYATGEYILFLDGDDRLYNKNVLTKIDNLIGKDEYEVVYLGYQDLGNENKTRISNKENSTKEVRISCDVTFSVSSRCWNNKFIKDNDMKFIEGMFYEDEVFCMKANILAEKTIYGEFPIFNYRRNRKGSAMSTPSIKKCSDWYRMMGEIIELLRITPEEYKPYLLSFIKNENESIPIRIANILQSLESGEETKILPKRDYKFRSFFDNEN